MAYFVEVDSYRLNLDDHADVLVVDLKFNNLHTLTQNFELMNVALMKFFLPEFWLKNAGFTCGAGICCCPILFGPPGPICGAGGGPLGGPCIFIFD